MIPGYFVGLRHLQMSTLIPNIHTEENASFFSAKGQTTEPISVGVSRMRRD